MRIPVCSLLFLIVFTAPVKVQITQSTDPVIVLPRPGDALQGVVTVIGSSDLSPFALAEISFTFEDNQTGTWFTIALNSQPVENDTLATWDTTVITDGNYILRLRVYRSDGSFQEAFVSGLRVRNYSQVETATPTAVIPEATPLPTITLTPQPFPTPTSLPRNPATLAPKDVSSSVLLGGLAAVMIMIIFGFYTWFKRK